MEDNDFIIDAMTWSFSRVNSFGTGCKKEWKEVYIDCENKVNSFYGQFGSFCHEILEKFFKGEMTEWDLAPYYEENYNEKITLLPPASIGDTCYEKGLTYFSNFSFPDNKYEILGVEKRVEFTILKYNFVGYIDLLLRDKETGEIIIVDHKSSTIKLLKNGNVSKGDAEHFLAFQRQLYLYSIPVIEEYGKVDRLKWNMFKDGTEIEIPFNPDDQKATVDWTIETIAQIEQEAEFQPNPDFFYCCNLCSRRADYCPFKRLGMIYDGIYSKCYSLKNPAYFDYGGSGIEICDEWKEDKQKFFTWALDNGYENDANLIRLDESEGFSPENCYWGIV